MEGTTADAHQIWDGRWYRWGPEWGLKRGDSMISRGQRSRETSQGQEIHQGSGDPPGVSNGVIPCLWGYHMEVTGIPRDTILGHDEDHGMGPLWYHPGELLS